MCTISTDTSNASKDSWIQCDDCSKWRKLNPESAFPDSFTCSAAGQHAPYNACDAEQGDGRPSFSDIQKSTSDDEVLRTM